MSTKESAIDTQAGQLPEHLDLSSEDIAGEHREELLRLFPDVATEGGKIDFDQLRRALGETVDSGKELYRLTWPGKSDCLRVIQTPSTGTLLPCPKESVNFDSSENVIIEADSLEALKLLRKSYIGRVTTIYLDPPYNTGKDFIYPDNYAESLQTYLEYTGQVDPEGKKFGTNTETDGRFHSNWLSMMYPRLYLARTLLREDGVLFISIDDHEVAALRLLLDEVFGPENFIATFVWKRKAGGGDDSGHVAAEHEYVLCYARDESKSKLSSILHESPAMTAKYSRKEGDRRYYLERLDKTSLTYNASMDFAIEAPDGSSIKPPQPNPKMPTTIWRWSAKTVAERREELIFGRDKTGEWRIYTRTWESLDGVTPRSLLVDKEHGRNRDGTQELASLLGPKVFSNPKPLKLMHHLMTIGAKDKEALVLDFFAGSGTTGQAILDLNEEDGGRRKFILVQLPEPTGRDDYPTLTAICEARVRRVIEKLNAADAGKLEIEQGRNLDRGFRVFKLAESNFTTWDSERAEGADTLEAQLERHVDHIRDGRSDDDLVFELLLKSGFTLATTVEPLELAGKKAFSVADGALLLCLDRELTLELIREIADRGPERVVCLDEGFAGNDQLKANAVQIFKTKGITSFKTV
jgi:adenine-specific DNA-methyltransferase